MSLWVIGVELLCVYPPPPPQDSFQDDQNFLPPPPEQLRGYGYQDGRDDFPPPPPQTEYRDSPTTRMYNTDYSGDRQSPYIRNESPVGGGTYIQQTGGSTYNQSTGSSTYNQPGNYANLSSIQSVYSSSGPTSQADSTIYARPVKITNRRSPETVSYGHSTTPDVPPGYVRQGMGEHRLYDTDRRTDIHQPDNYGRTQSTSSTGFSPGYDYDDRPKPGPQVPRAEFIQHQQLPMADYVQPLGPGSGQEKSGKEAEVDALTSLLMQNMESSNEPEFFGICVKCGKKVIGENNGCTANGQIYHIACFVCVSCGTLLRGKSFYSMDNKPYCEPCYINTLERCSVCSKPITDRLLRATGKPYHPECFTCVVCGMSLDGIPFTVDATNQIHCIDCFHKKFAPRCCVCQQPIMPEKGMEETVRVVALDKSFHIQCYRCEDCSMLLSSEAEGRGCYPLDDSILCKNCNAKRIQAMSSKMATEL
ncbi:hypothetical protein FSP39_015392 [Pinctada imbricata]|uniref:LIM zinc-binding domain-containing protein n=1 Tax=Pinctada imbricata TaxID=66713 RepID=A0AA88XUU9_PINIB|nr:hypothetical protein FSP39_015392 [Pinctada imbricata]